MKKLLSMFLVLALCLTNLAAFAEDAAELEAQFAAAKALYDEEKYSEAFAPMLALAEKGHVEAMHCVGRMYHVEDIGATNGQPDYAAAKEWYLKAVEFNDAVSMNNLGYGYVYGHFSEDGQPDYATAKEWYLKAAELGYAKAMNNLALNYKRGHFSEDGQPDYAAAKEWFLKAAELGHVDSMTALATGYWAGYFSEDGQPDYATAKEWDLKAAELGSSESLYSVGYGYYTGDYTEDGQPDYLTAKEWFLKAAERGNADAMYALGYYYDEGYFGEEGKANHEEILKWWKMAAEHGNTSSLYSLGRFYAHTVEPHDYAQAREWLLKAAEKEVRSAIDALGHHYRNGDFNGGVPDYEQALAWYMNGAELGYASSEDWVLDFYNNNLMEHAALMDFLQSRVRAGTTNTNIYDWLGYHYSNPAEDSGMMANYDLALEAYTVGAELGSGYSMAQIGSLYRDGRLGDADHETAREWYNKALEAGYADAQAALDGLNAQ